MADFGFFCQSDEGYAQVDGDYRNLALWDEGSASVDTQNLSPCWEWTRYVATISLPSARTVPPLVSVGLGTNEGAMLLGLERDGNGDVTAIKVATSDNKSFLDYQLFIPVSELPVTSDDWGMQVWDDSGARAFDTGYRYLRITDIFEASPSSRGPWSHDGVPSPHYVLGTFGGWWASESEYLLAIWRSGNAEVELAYLPPYNANLVLGCLFESGYEWDTHFAMVARKS